MGFRTVVMLANDHAHEWQNDPELGKKIAMAMNHAGLNRNDRSRVDNYGCVVECVHGDSQTLAVLDGYTSFDVIAGKGWQRGEVKDAIAFALLKEAAAKLGYRLAKKRAAKP